MSADLKLEEMDTNIIKSDWYLAIMIFTSVLRLLIQLHTLKKQARTHQITKESLEISSAVRTLVKLDRYVSELLTNFKKRYWKR